MSAQTFKEPTVLGAPCAHEGFVSHHFTGGQGYDFDRNHGYCHDCLTWVIRTAWHKGERVEFKVMNAQQRSALAGIEGRYRRADAT